MTRFVFSRDSWQRAAPDGFPDLRVPRYVEKPVRSRSGISCGLRENHENLLNVRADFDDFGEISKILEKMALFLEIPALRLSRIHRVFSQSPRAGSKNGKYTPPIRALWYALRTVQHKISPSFVGARPFPAPCQ